MWREVICLIMALLCLSCVKDSTEGESADKISISEFIDMADSGEKLFRLDITTVSISDPENGCLYVADESGWLYVHGLSTYGKSGSHGDFPSLGIEAGDRISIASGRNIFNGRVEAGGLSPARLLDHEPHPYPGKVGKLSNEGWLELPATQKDDYRDILYHFNFRMSGQAAHGKAFTSGETALSGQNRSHTICWDRCNLVPLWVAGPLYRDIIGTGKRTDAWSFDPLLDYEAQPSITYHSYRKGNAGGYVRGHLLPSADRLSPEGNILTFSVTNAAPQDASLNSGIWSVLESTVRNKWCMRSDTLYIVTGVDINGSSLFVLDDEGKQVTVPKGFYKTILRHSVGEEPIGAAFYFENRPYDGKTTLKDVAVSIDSLESITGLDFFSNLPDMTENETESQNPLEHLWWWE